MRIEIVGTGCAKCKALTANVEQAVRELGLDAEVSKVEKVTEIARMGVMMTPGLAVDGQVLSMGRLLTVEEVKQILGDPASGA